MAEATDADRLAVLRQHYALNGVGDYASARELPTDDFEITIPAFMPFGGTYRGKDAFVELIPRVRQAAKVEGLTFVATTIGGDHAVEIVEFALAGQNGTPPQVAEMSRFRGIKSARFSRSIPIPTHSWPIRLRAKRRVHNGCLQAGMT